MEMTIFYSNIDRFGNNLLIRGFENGKRFNRKHKFYPTFHVPDPNGDWQSLDGRTLSEIKPGDMKECRDFIDKYEDVANFGVYGTTNYVHQFISEAYPGKIKYDRTKLNICTIDIEVGSEDGFPEPRDAKHEIITITIKDNNQDLYHTWGSYDFDSDKCEQDVFYHRCRDERDLLLSFLEYWSFHIPDIITGWYSDFFDIPYLVNRIARVLGEGCVYSLSPWRKVSADNKIIAGREQVGFDIMGISQLDYIDLFKKFTLNTLGQQESYKLDHIANVVLGEKKLDYSEYGSLHTLYKSDYQKFVEYNIKDVQLVDRIEEKLGLIDLVLTMAYRAKCTLKETLGTVGIWDAILYNEFKRRKIAVPQKKTSSYNTIEGGHVKDPQIGIHDWVVSFDLNSLYPHIIMQYNMSPETVVNDIRRNTTIDELLGLCSENKDANIPDDRCLTATGQLFRNDVEGIIPQIIQEYYDERVQIKKEMLKIQQQNEDIKINYASFNDRQRPQYNIAEENDKRISVLNNNQMAIKIAMNSFYGALANKYFRYFDVRVAEAITVSGQFTIRWAEKTLNEYLNKMLKTDTDYVIAIDTDSVYLNLGPFVDKVMPGETDKNKIVNFLDKASAQIEKHLDKGYTQLASFMQAPRQKMVMAREIIADKAVWTAKKRYIAHVWDSEGVRYAEPKLKVTGVEAVRSSTPQVCRELITDTLKKIVTSSESEVQKYIEELRVEYMKLSPEDIAFPRGVSEMEKWADAASLYKKGTPIHVRAALLYNDQLNKNKLVSRYERIMSGNKMKFLYMKMPNPLHENVFGFVNVLPKELDLAQYIDYNKQFEKSFLDPIQIVLDAMGWDAEKQNNLEDFFG